MKGPCASADRGLTSSHAHDWRSQVTDPITRPLNGTRPQMTATPVEPLNAALEGRYRIEREVGAGWMATVSPRAPHRTRP